MKALPILLLLALAPGLAEARTVRLGEPPVAEITIPDAGWGIDVAEGAVEATAANADAYLSADVYDATDVPEAGRNTARFLLEQKIKLDPKSKAQTEVRIAGLQALETSWTGTDADGPTRFRIWFVKLRPDRLVLFTYWRSEAGERAHGAEVAAITGSLKPLP